MNATEQKIIMRRLKLSNGKPVLINGLFYWIENENIFCSFPSAKAIRNAEKIGTVLDNEYSFFEPIEEKKMYTFALPPSVKDRLSKTAHDWGFDSSSALVEFLIERMNPILNIENYAETEGLKIPS